MHNCTYFLDRATEGVSSSLASDFHHFSFLGMLAVDASSSSSSEETDGSGATDSLLTAWLSYIEQSTDISPVSMVVQASYVTCTSSLDDSDFLDLSVESFFVDDEVGGLVDIWSGALGCSDVPEGPEGPEGGGGGGGCREWSEGGIE